ncbi:hypothetical protein [Sporosarcina sp. OR05]|uniref:hypothetical protein n=1 Tax=Sporosarcina sp. OR05 TaxID=2969819 RepID=UPI00352A30EC
MEKPALCGFFILRWMWLAGGYAAFLGNMRRFGELCGVLRKYAAICARMRRFEEICRVLKIYAVFELPSRRVDKSV